MELNYNDLEKSICDTIKEGQIKLGFEKETMGLYYPLSSLQSLLGLEKSKDNEPKEITNMIMCLKGFKDSVKDRLGSIIIGNKGSRFSFTIPVDGVTYVHKTYKANQTFLEFIHLIRNHGVTLDHILTLFRRFSTDVICLESTNEDFDYIVYFEDSKIDPYLYCLKFEGEHVSYHRYIKSDFEELMGM